MSALTTSITDLLNAQYDESARSGLAATFYERMEWLDQMKKKGRVKPGPGTPHITDQFVYQAPGALIPILVGDEVITPTLKNITKAVKVAPGKMACLIAIPNRLLTQNANSKLRLMELVKQYPETMMGAVVKTLNQFTLTATIPSVGAAVASVSDMSNVTTLNGAWASGTETGVTNGLLDFAATTSQSDTVQDLAKSTTYGYVNQYQNISSWTADGRRQLIKLYTQCRDKDPNQKGPDLILMDLETKLNYFQEMTNRVLLTSPNDKLGDFAVSSLDFEGAKIVQDPCMDRTASIFSGTAMANGFGYMLNTEYLTWYEYLPISIGKFEPYQGTDYQAAWLAFDGNMLCTRMNAQGCWSGGAV